MSRFHAPLTPKAGTRPTTNLAGGDAFDRDAKTVLASLVLTSLVQDSFYKIGSDELSELQRVALELAQAGELLYCAKAAVYSRSVHGLRSIAHALAGEVAQLRSMVPDQRGQWGPRFFERVVVRLDDMSEIAGYWIGRYAKGKKKTLPNAMKRGFARVYACAKPELLAKWNKSGTPTLRQLAHLVHPTAEKGSTLYALRGGTLAAADTHEVAMSRAGQGEDVDATKAAEWARLFSERKLKYIAALRNVRRILEQAPECVSQLCELLESAADVRGSRVLPFQFLAAHDAVSELAGPAVKRALASIEIGAEHSLSNAPRLEGSTLVALDDSGSMTGKPAKMGAMFAAALVRTCADADLVLFDTQARYVNVGARDSLFGCARQLMAACQGGGTNFGSIFAAAARRYDRVVILSDMQGWQNGLPGPALTSYEKQHGRPWIYSWDLVASSTAQFPAPRVCAIAGISDKAFELMANLEQDPRAMVSAIEAVEL